MITTIDRLMGRSSIVTLSFCFVYSSTLSLLLLLQSKNALKLVRRRRRGGERGAAATTCWSCCVDHPPCVSIFHWSSDQVPFIILLRTQSFSLTRAIQFVKSPWCATWSGARASLISRFRWLLRRVRHIAIKLCGAKAQIDLNLMLLKVVELLWCGGRVMTKSISRVKIPWVSFSRPPSSEWAIDRWLLSPIGLLRRRDDRWLEFRRGHHRVLQRGGGGEERRINF